MTKRVVIHSDSDALARTTAARLLVTLIDLCAVQDRVDVVLTGGTVGIRTLAMAAQNPIVRDVDWSIVHVWWGDERFVAKDSPERNARQAYEALLADLPLPAGNIHEVSSTDDGIDVDEAAQRYARDLQLAHSDKSGLNFDVLLLGMGPDGHVASLFPGHPDAMTSGVAVGVHDSPKPPPSRVSLTYDAINAARRVWVIAAGEEKAPAVAQALVSVDPVSLPASAVCGVVETLWLIDASAASAIEVAEVP